MGTTITIEEAIIRLAMAAVCGGVIGAERLIRGRAAGIRTFSILGLGSALTVVVGIYAFSIYGDATDPVRIAAQVLSGISFLGIGVIFTRGKNEIVGLTTAAGLWTTAAVGIAIGLGLYWIGIFSTGAAFIIIIAINKLEGNLKERRYGQILYIEISGVRNADEINDILRDRFTVKEVTVSKPRSGSVNNVGLEVVFEPEKKHDIKAIKNEIRQISEDILMVVEIRGSN